MYKLNNYFLKNPLYLVAVAHSYALLDGVGSGVGRGGALGAIAPPLGVSWDLFFGISHFCSFKTVDLTRVF